MPKAFLCHSSKDSDFILQVATYLKKSLEWVFLYEENQRCDQSFVDTITNALNDCDIMIIFVGPGGLSEYQLEEYQTAWRISHDKNRSRKFIIILLPGVEDAPSKINLINGLPVIKVDKLDEGEACRISKEIIHDLKLVWESDDDLPLNPHLFDYEKDIINYFIDKSLLEQQIAEIESQLPKIDPKSDEYLKLQADLCDHQENYQKIRDKLLDGCPVKWPKVTRWTDHMQPNQLDENLVGKFRKDDARVVTAALSNSHLDFSLIEKELWFPEAGPRGMLEFPQKMHDLNVAVVVSGGIAPGINAVIDGIAQRHHMYAKKQKYTVNVFGYKNGLQAFEALNMSQCILIPGDDDTPPAIPIETIETSSHVDEGGSIIGTSRYEDLNDPSLRKDKLTNIVTQLFLNHIDILYIIGGDGSMKAAHAIWSYAQEYAHVHHVSHKVSVVAIPKSMDNDILWVWQTFGFLSAVERAREIIQHLVTEARSNPRLGVVQLFGSDSGFVVSHAVLASRTGICDAALIPEIKFSMQELARYLKKRICARYHKPGHTSYIPYGFIVLAETAIPTDAMDFLDIAAIGLDDAEKEAVKDFTEKRNHSQRIEGQTNDALRTAGLKIVSRGLLKLIPDLQVDDTVQPDWKKLRVSTNEPRHLLRATPPGCNDIITAQRLGILAVDNALAGFTDFMVSQWLTEYVLVPLKLVVLGRKRIPTEGIFWKSVLAKTGQYFNMD